MFRRHLSLVCLLTVVISVGGLASATAQVGFVDVPPTHTFFVEINWLGSSGITKGCNPPANDRFCPGDLVTRGQMAAFLARAFELDDDGGLDWFVDDNGTLFESDINRVAAAGITKGCNPPTNDRFCPSDLVTRGQMAAFLARAFDLEDDGGYDWFVDDNGTLFESDIDRVAAAGITKGCNPPANDRFCSSEYVTRGQMAAFLFRGMTAGEARIELTVELTPSPPYHLWDEVGAVLGVANTGNQPFVDVSVRPQHLCWGDNLTGPTFGVGDTDTMLEPGERWDYACQARANRHEFVDFQVVVEGLDGAMTEEGVSLRYVAADPVEVVVTASETSVSPGTVVTFSATVTNVGSVAGESAGAQGRLIEEGGTGPWPYFPMQGPTKLVGDDDDFLEPGEVWEWVDTETINSDAYYDADISMDPVIEPGSHYGFHGQSDVVRVM